MFNRLNKTSICSIVFLDIVEYSSKSGAEQIAEKALFNGLVAESLKGIALSDRIILDTGDGAAISLVGEPEEALFVSISIRDGIINNNQTSKSPIFVRIGINLGPVRVVKDINGQLNILGDGINVAQRIMTFAEPNQIMVSRSYFEVTSRLTKEFTSMFTYFGFKQDKHVREHEVYLINASAIVPNLEVSSNVQAAPTNQEAKSELVSKQEKTLMSAKAAIFANAARSNLKALPSYTVTLGWLRKYILWVLPLLAVFIVLSLYNNKTTLRASQAFTPEVVNSVNKSKVLPDIPLNSQVPPDSVLIKPQAEIPTKKLEQTKVAKSTHAKKTKVVKLADVKPQVQPRLDENKFKVAQHTVSEHIALEHQPQERVETKSTVSIVKTCTTGEIALNQCK